MHAKPDDGETRLPVAWRLRPFPVDLQTVPGQPEDEDEDEDDDDRGRGGEGNIEPDADEGGEGDDEDDEKDEEEDEEPWQVRSEVAGAHRCSLG